MLKILQARLQQYVNRELPDVQTGFRKGRRKWQPTPVFLPGESRDRGAWQTTVHVVVRVEHGFHCLIWPLWMDNQQSTVITLSVS